MKTVKFFLLSLIVFVVTLTANEKVLLEPKAVVAASMVDNTHVIQNGIEIYAFSSSYGGSGGPINASWIIINHNDYPVSVISFTDERYDQSQQTTWSLTWRPGDYGIDVTIPAHGWISHYAGYGYGTAYYVRTIPEFNNGVIAAPDYYALQQPSGYIQYPLPINDENSSLEADRTIAPADGMTSIALKATLRDVEGNPLADREVSFSTDYEDVITRPISYTNSNGEIFAYLRSSIARVRKIQVRDETDFTTLSQTLIITFTKVFLDLPVSYFNFAQAASGNVGGASTGRVNSWFDHTYPTYGINNNLTRYDGVFFDFHNVPSEKGISWYDGHSGIDFSHDRSQSDEPVFAAANGKVFGVVNNCQNSGGGCKVSGNQVWIDHHNGYATLYCHLKKALVTNDTEITDRIAQPLGIMGSTGSGAEGTHLHFSLYYDQNGDGQWSKSEVVDPYGWQGTANDPWSIPSSYLWIHPLSAQQPLTSSGGSTSTPSGNLVVTVPAGAVSSPVTLELWDTPPVAGASATLRSTGNSFWMRVLEWLTGGSSSSLMASASTNSFDVPVTVTVHYDPSWMPHLDTNQLTLYQWNDVGQTWVALPTTLDTVNQQATAQTSQPGYFDLQGPLVCPADTLEPNDNYDSSSVVQTNGTPVSNLFDIATDEDWFQFNGVAGTQYRVRTTNLGAGVDTVLEIYDTDGVTLLASDDNSGGGNASSLTWQAPQDGVYFARIVQAPGSSFGCGATYNFAALATYRIYLPLVIR